MIKARYAGIGTNCPLFDVLVLGAGNLTSSGTLYFSFQLQNRAGYNIPSVSSAISYTAGQQIQITIPETVKQPGWDIHYYIVSAGTTSNPSTHVQIARYPGFEYEIGFDPQATRTTLPATITLSRDEHIGLAPSVADLNSLPTGLNRLDGQVRWVASESKWFTYRADSNLPLSVDVIAADIGQWVRMGTAGVYVSDTRSGAGSDRIVTAVNPVTAIPTPPYPGNNIGKVLPQWEAQYWLYNNGTNVLPAGTEFGIALEYNNRRSPDLLDGLFLVKFIGFIRSDGTVRTQTSAGLEFPNLGAFITWTPKKTAPFLTIDDLQPGEAIALAVKPFFSSAELNNQVTPKSVIGVIPVIRTQSGDYNSLGKVMGSNVVYDIGDKYRIVPNTLLSYDILSGIALVGGYDFPKKERRTFGNLQAGIPGQKVIINGNGGVYSELDSYVPSSSEDIRAIVGTAAGESSVGNFTTYTAGSGFNISFTHPTLIRSDYPDVIAGSDKGKFNAIYINFYIQREDTLEIRKFTGYMTLPDGVQEYTISNWDSGTVAALPTPNADFSLFTPSNVTITSITGNFPATNFRVAYSFQYDGYQITSISHSTPPCIKEIVGDLKPPTVQVNPTITTVAHGEPATVTNTGTTSDLNLTFTLPAGEPGLPGENGINAFTQITADFTIPAIGTTVTIAVGSSEWMSPGQLIYIENTGSFTVISKPDPISAIIRNDGYQGNLNPGVIIIAPKGVSPSGAVGLSGTSGYTTTTADFLQPAIGLTVEVAVADSNWIPVGLIAFISVGGYYRVQSKPSSTAVVVENLGYSVNAAEGATIAISQTVSSGGVRGGSGIDGVDGINAYTTTTANFTQPSVGIAVTISAGSSAWMSVGQVVFVEDAGSYQVAVIPDSISATLVNLGYSHNVASGTSVVAPKKVTPAGLNGDTGIGTPGQPAYTSTTSSFVQPASGANVIIEVGSSDWAGVGARVFVVSGGTYQVISKPSAISLEIQNLATYSTNTAAGATINSGVLVAPTGTQGEQGATGTVTGSSGLILNPASSITTGVNEYGVYFDSITGFLKYRFPENGATAIVGNYQNAIYLLPLTTPSTPSTAHAFFVDSADGRIKKRGSSDGAVNPFAFINLPQQYSNFQGSVRVTQNISGSVTLDGSLANIYDLTVTAEVTNLTVNNLQSGFYIFNIIQGTTPYPVTLDGDVFKIQDDDISVISITTNKKSKITGECNGTTIEYAIGVWSI